MHGVTQPSSLAPGIQAGSRPSAAATLRLAANEAPEHQRPALLSAFFERMGVRYDTEPTGDAPVEIDLTVQALPGLQLMSGQMLGARVRRIRESNDPTDDVGLIVNPAGHHLLSQRGREIVLGEGEAALVSLVDPLISVQRPPGRMLALRLLMPPLASRLAGGGDCFMRRIPQSSAALRLLTGYHGIVSQQHMRTSLDAQHQVVSHFYDLTAVAIGATRDAAELAEGYGLRAARLHAIKQDIAKHLSQPALDHGACVAPRLHAALHPAAVRERRHELDRLCADAAPRVLAPHARRPAPRRREDQHDRARRRLRRSVLLQPRLPPALWRYAVGDPRVRSRGSAVIGPHAIARK